MLISSGCLFVFKSLEGCKIEGVLGGVFATVIIVSFCFVFVPSVTMPVTFIAHPLEQLTLKFCENCASSPDKVKLKYLLKPVSLTTICPVESPVLSVALKVAFIISYLLGDVLFIVPFITGAVESILNCLVSDSEDAAPSVEFAFQK